jgi:hypothetical protein
VAFEYVDYETQYRPLPNYSEQACRPQWTPQKHADYIFITCSAESVRALIAFHVLKIHAQNVL